MSRSTCAPSRSRLSLALPVVALTVVGASGCTSNPGQSGPVPCPAGTAKDPGGVCRPLCTTDDDCTACQSCDGQFCRALARCPCEVSSDCDDGDPCNGAEVCDAEELCAAGEPVVCPDVGGRCVENACANQGGQAVCVAGFAAGCRCTADAECDDDVVCHANVCDTGTGTCQVQNAADSSPCDDGFDCTLLDRCQAGRCLGDANDLVCAPFADLCGDAACDPTRGCVKLAKNDGTPCDDAIACTTGDACTDGYCRGAEQDAACPEDGNPCTTTSCSWTGGGCVVAELPDSTPCDDAIACTTPDRCTAGSCAGTADDGLCADDGNPCTVALCDPDSGCVTFDVEDDTPCSDGVACTSESCQGGQCLAVPNDAACDDDNPCTANSCDPVSGCQSVDLTGGCDDGNPCTANDTCGGGTCAGQAAPLELAACDDGDSGTTPDLCLSGSCVGGRSSSLTPGVLRTCDGGTTTWETVALDFRVGDFVGVLNSQCSLTDLNRDAVGVYRVGIDGSFTRFGLANGQARHLRRNLIVGDSPLSGALIGVLGTANTSASLSWTGTPWHSASYNLEELVDVALVTDGDANEGLAFFTGYQTNGGIRVRPCAFTLAADLTTFSSASCTASADLLPLAAPEPTALLGFGRSLGTSPQTYAYDGLAWLGQDASSAALYHDSTLSQDLVEASLSANTTFYGAIARSATELFLFGSASGAVPLQRCTKTVGAGSLSCAPLSVDAFAASGDSVRGAALLPGAHLAFVGQRIENSTGFQFRRNRLWILRAGQSATQASSWRSYSLPGGGPITSPVPRPEVIAGSTDDGLLILGPSRASGAESITLWRFPIP